jgi:hypothetical protein
VTKNDMDASIKHSFKGRFVELTEEEIDACIKHSFREYEVGHNVRKRFEKGINEDI